LNFLSQARFGKSFLYAGINFNTCLSEHSKCSSTHFAASCAFMIFSFRQCGLFSRHASKNLQRFRIFDDFETGGFRIFGIIGRLWLAPYPTLLC